MRICHIASGDLWAGAEVQVATLLTQLRRCPEVQLSFVVLNEGILADTVRGLGINTVVFPESKLSFRQMLSQSGEFLRRERPDLIHSHRYKENLLAAIAGRRAGVKQFVRTQHGYHEIPQKSQSQRQRFVNAIDRFLARHMTSRVIAVSEELAARIRPLYGHSVVQVIPNGVDFSRTQIELSVDKAKAELGFMPDTPVVAFVGRLEPVKRPDLFIATAAQIIAQLPSVRFIMVGDGKQRTAVDAQVSSLQLADRIQLVGHRRDVLELLRASDVLLIPSDHEGLPMVLLEALALGTVVVARAVGGLCEVIENGRNGVLVESGTAADLAGAVVQVLRMSAVNREHLSAAGRRTVAGRYSSEYNAEQIVELYRSLLEHA
jgi:L-malate glycosyltransferase